MAEECGDKNLIRAAGGQTYDRVCKGVFGVTLYCNLEDYDDWRIRLDELAEQLVVTWNRLITIENERKDWPKTRAVRDWYNRILARIEALPSASAWGPVASINPFADEAPSKVIAQMVGIATDITCLLEVMRNGIKSYDETPPPVPHVTPEKGPQIDISTPLETATKAAKETVQSLAWPLAIVGTALLLAPVVAKRIAKGGG